MIAILGILPLDRGDAGSDGPFAASIRGLPIRRALALAASTTAASPARLSRVVTRPRHEAVLACAVAGGDRLGHSGFGNLRGVGRMKRAWAACALILAGCGQRLGTYRVEDVAFITPDQGKHEGVLPDGSAYMALPPPGIHLMWH